MAYCKENVVNRRHNSTIMHHFLISAALISVLYIFFGIFYPDTQIHFRIPIQQKKFHLAAEMLGLATADFWFGS
jgi:hypothetical protein